MTELPNFDAVEKIHYGVIAAAACPELANEIEQNGDCDEYDLYCDFLEFLLLQAYLMPSGSEELQWWCRWFLRWNPDVAWTLADFDTADWYKEVKQLVTYSRQLKSDAKYAREHTAYGYKNRMLPGARSLLSYNDDQPQHYRYEQNGVTYVCDVEPDTPSYIFVIKSRYVGYCRLCSPCFPNAGDIEALQPYEEGQLTYLPHTDFLSHYLIKAGKVNGQWLDRTDWLPVLNHGDWFGKTWLVSVACGHFSISAIVEADHPGDAEEIAAEHEEFGRLVRIEPPDTADYTTVMEEDDEFVVYNLDGKELARAKTRKELEKWPDMNYGITGDGRAYDQESMMVAGQEGANEPFPVQFYVVEPNPVPIGHVPCKVEWHAGCVLLVHFDDGLELDFQSENDQAEFCFACGLFTLKEEEKYASQAQGWIDCDPQEIKSCPDDYYRIAKEAHEERKRDAEAKNKAVAGGA